MITAVALTGLALLAAGPASSSLAHGDWTRRYPRAGVATWFSLAILILTSLVGAGLSLTSESAAPTASGAIGSLMSSLSGPRPLTTWVAYLMPASSGGSVNHRRQES